MFPPWSYFHSITSLQIGSWHILEHRCRLAFHLILLQLVHPEHFLEEMKRKRRTMEFNNIFLEVWSPICFDQPADFCCDLKSSCRRFQQDERTNKKTSDDKKNKQIMKRHQIYVVRQYAYVHGERERNVSTIWRNNKNISWILCLLPIIIQKS